MLRTFCYSVVAVLMLIPASLIAGGPPLLCLPLDGVTSENLQACTELLNSKLASKVWEHAERPAVRLVESGNQWYLTFHMGGEVKLSDVRAALEGSKVSVPLDKLRLFGHAILEIDARGASQDKLLADLDAVHHLSIEESNPSKDSVFRVTLDMPYPVHNRNDRESLGWSTFRRGDFSADQAARVEGPTTASRLPSYEKLRAIVAAHDARLKDLSWSQNYACRVLGCVAVSDSQGNSADASLPVGKWNVEFANKVTEVCEISDSEGGLALVEEPQRKSHGSVVSKAGSFVITFDDDRVERWTPVGKRYIVEHWFPGSEVPSGTPVLGIADRAP